MRKFLLIFGLCGLFGFQTQSFGASTPPELDDENSAVNQNQRAPELPGTLLIRVNEQTGESEYLEYKKAMAIQDITPESIAEENFLALNVDERQMNHEDLGELDKDRGQGAESWYFYLGFYAGVSYSPWSYAYQPYYWHYGRPYYYTNYHHYYYGGWNYYWHRRPHYRRHWRHHRYGYGW